MKKMDRRVRRSRRLLGEALLSLILRQSYESITIQQITDEADLNRATFYLHYGSKEELLYATLAERFDALVAEILPAMNGPFWEDDAPIRLTFQHVAENATLYKVLLSDNGLGYVMHRILHYIANFNMQKFAESAQVETAETAAYELASWHTAGSLLALIIWWLENDMALSIVEMTQRVQQMCVQGVLPLVGMEERADGHS